jgi:hypothetical protein
MSPGAKTVPGRPPRLAAAAADKTVMNGSDEMPLTVVLDRLSEMCKRNQLNLDELGLYRGLCVLEAAVLDADLRRLSETA